ncbi:MAG: histidine phosphatase family protein [Deltaproteobacteria bacterium]|nr:histidine phosphatase family protein [Deltaproteobacteria bacterium]
MRDVPESEVPWGRDVLRAVAAVPAERPAAVMVRHSERESLTDMNEAHLIPLTAQGEEAARAFGRHLPAGRTVRALHSPISRCAVTAARVVEGYRSAGGDAALAGVLPELGGPYVLDLPATIRISNELRARYPRAWFDGDLPPGVAMPRDEASDLTLTGVDKVLRGAAAGTLLVLVTHDWNVLLVRESVLGLRFEDVGWIDYLDGLLMVSDGAGLEVSWREHSRRVAVPASAPEPQR